MKILAAAVVGALALAGTALGVLHSVSAKTVKVTEKEWGMPAVPAKAPAGKITFVVRNAGKLKHEFVIVKTRRAAAKLPVKGGKAVETGRVGKIREFKPGQTRRLTLTLKAGHYVLFCNLPAHYKAGQRSNFSVKAS
jgi:uncharacterized cupredoxin-like copper-binding protein